MAIGSFGAIVLAEAFKLHLAVVRPPPHSPSLPHCSPAAISNSISFPLLLVPPFGRSRSLGRSSQFLLAFRIREYGDVRAC